MLFKKKEEDLKLPKLPLEKEEKGILGIFKRKIKKVEIPETEEEPEFLKKLDIGEKEGKIEPEFYFWLCDGRIIRDLKELTHAIGDIKENVFKFHVTDYKNDFSNWIRDVIGNEKLAEELSKAKTREESYAVLTGKKIEKKKKKKEERKIQLEEIKAPEPPKIEEIKENSEEKKEEDGEKLEQQNNILDELTGLKAEEEALEKIEEVIKKPEPLLSYNGEIAHKQITEKKETEVKEEKVKEPAAIEALKGKTPKKIVNPLENVPKEKKKTNENNIEKINKILDDAINSFNRGDAEIAKDLTRKAKIMLQKASIPNEDKKSLNYRLVEIETKAKLFMLN